MERERLDIYAHIYLDIMGKSFKDPPSYHKDKPYSRWKIEVNHWADMVVTNGSINQESVGQVVALSALPDCHEQGDIRGKVMDAVGKDIKGATGLTKILAWMDEHLGRDETQTCVDKAADFMTYRRTDGQTVKDYLAGFDSKYNAAKTAGLGEMGQIFLMWMVVDHAGVTESQFQLIMSQVDLESKDTLYAQAKAGMIKMMAGINAGDGTRSDRGLRHRESNTMFANTGWKPMRPYQPRFPIKLPGSGTGPRFSPRPGGGGGAYGGGNGAFRPRTQINVPRNPIKNGKQELCDICGSFTHFRRGCPHNPDFQAMMGEVEETAVDGGYLYDEDYVYVSNTPEHIITDSGPDNTEILSATENQAANDHVAALIASLKIGGDRHDNEVNVLVSHILNNEVIKAGLGEVVLDTGCIKSVTSSKWLNNFIESLHPSTRERIKVDKSDRVFKFGGGQKRHSIGTFFIPCSIENKNIILIVDGVEQDDLPCLLSKESMKKAGVIIDIANDQATFFDKKIRLQENDAGHYIIKLQDYQYDDKHCSVMWSGEGKTDDELMQDLKRMHAGLGHPSQETFERMLRNDGSFNKNVHFILNKLYEKCMTCLKHKKSKSIPKVAPPMSQDVNDTITLDLKLYPKLGKNILYIIDDFSRYVTAVVIPDKKGETIVREFLDKWVYGTPYGPCKQLHTDNGGEFVNQEMKQMVEALGIKHVTTGAYSPFSNGLNERNHHTVDIMLEKIMDADKNIRFEDALAKAVYAKNTMLNVQGFSPAQILAGKQPRLPGATNNNKPPEDESDISSKTVYDRLKSLQMAREAFIKVDNGNRLKRAMKVAPSPLEYYPPGTEVFYKYGNDSKWHGPGKIVGQDNKVVLIRHGGHIISTSQTRVFRAPGPGQMGLDMQMSKATRPAAPSATESDSSSEDSDDEDNEDVTVSGRRQAPTTPHTPGGHEGLVHAGGDTTPSQDTGSPASDTEMDRAGLGIRERPPTEIFQFRPDQLQTSSEGDISLSEESESEESEQSQDLTMARTYPGKKSSRATTKSPTTFPKKGVYILYKEKDQDLWFRAQILKKGVKASNPLPYYNIQPDFGSPRGVNLNDYDWQYDSP